MQVSRLRQSRRSRWSAEGVCGWKSGPAAPVPARRFLPVGLLQTERLGNSHLPLEMQPKATASKKPFESPLFCPPGQGGSGLARSSGLQMCLAMLGPRFHLSPLRSFPEDGGILGA